MPGYTRLLGVEPEPLEDVVACFGLVAQQEALVDAAVQSALFLLTVARPLGNKFILPQLLADLTHQVR